MHPFLEKVFGMGSDRGDLSRGQRRRMKHRKITQKGAFGQSAGQKRYRQESY